MENLINQLIWQAGWKKKSCITRILPEKSPEYAAGRLELSPFTAKLLEHNGISRLYKHQSRAIDALKNGHNVLLATPTASGKSLVYQIPILDAIAHDPAASALLVFPFKALARDQERSFHYFPDCVPPLGSSRTLSEVYDGDTPTAERKRIRKDPPHILITNPDMIHYSFLPYHTRWAPFLASIQYLVMDEIHVYRGVFGSHVLQIIRRLLRILRHYGADPRVIACSATIGNPGDHVQNLFQKKFTVIVESGAPLESKAFISHFPGDSASTAAVKMLEACLKNNLKTIVFTKSRRSTELLYRYITDRNPGLLSRLAVYRAGFMPGHRREIEKRLFNNELSGVISTSALELGINVGGLDCCILVGFPGSISSLMQRAGRVGRQQQPSIIIYIAGEDALDRYWYEHEEQLHTSPVEHAVVYENNDDITDGHLECAADELILIPGSNFPDTPYVRQRIQLLTDNNKLLECVEKGKFVCREPMPQRRISIRSIGESYEIRHEKGHIIGYIDGVRVFKECHQGAVYLHAGEIFQVQTLDIENYRVTVRSGPDDIYTQPVSGKETDILSVDGKLNLPFLRVQNGRLKVREKITGYTVKRIYSGDIVSRHELDLPELIFETRGLWMSFPETILDDCRMNNLHPMGGLHALEHALIGLYPLFSLCDRNDLAGISTPAHHQINGAAVFIYDAFPGGLGLAESALSRFEELLRFTLQHISSCPCDDGCPYCIHSPKCGSGNVPLDKAATIHILEFVCGIRTPCAEPCTSSAARDPVRSQLIGFPSAELNRDVKSTPSQNTFFIPPLPEKNECPVGTEIVFDIETQLSADEVGGWKNADKMRIAIGVVLDISLNRYEFYLEKDALRLVDRLTNASRVIGYNSEHFDFTVLKGYTSQNRIRQIKSLDLIRGITKGLGHRTGLATVAAATVGATKTADGLQSLQWWREGLLDRIAEYCRRDVEVTNLLYQFGKTHGYVLHPHRSGELIRIPVFWQE
jgi:DEAD/DEAH box helicase domain-containing protein